MNEYIIRRMEKGDITSLAKLDIECFSVPWSKQSFEEEFYNDNAVYYVAEKNNELAGYIGFWEILDEGHITNIAVLPAHRRKSVGTFLLLESIKCARKDNLNLLTLEVRVSNTAAISFYEKFNFIKTGKRKNFYKSPREDAIIMTLMLGENE